MNATSKEVVENRKKWFSAIHQRGKSPIWDYSLLLQVPVLSALSDILHGTAAGRDEGDAAVR